MVTLQEMKNYLRVDDDDDDALIETIIASAERQCMDILRTDSEEELASVQNGKTAVMFTAAYLYEHREEADHHTLNLTLQCPCSSAAGRRRSDGDCPTECKSDLPEEFCGVGFYWEPEECLGGLLYLPCHGQRRERAGKGSRRIDGGRQPTLLLPSVSANGRRR